MSSVTSGARVLAWFAKEPRPGTVKTRVGGTPAWAAQVASAFLLDLVERFASFPAQRFLVFSPAEAEPYFQSLARGRFELAVQQPGDLGQRMAAFVTERQRGGAKKVVLLGTDS